MNYYPFGLTHTQPLGSDLPNRYLFNGKELTSDLGLGIYDYITRNYDPALGRFWQIDLLADQMSRFSPYSYAFDNPIRFTDPDGMAPFDFVQRQDGSIYWDNNANSQATTQAGETYLGKTLTFNFNSNIAGDLWDGPGGSAPVGDKLTSTVTLTGSENSEGALTGISATKQIKVGSTPVGTARDYFAGLGDDQNKFTSGQSTNKDGTLSTYSLNFEQHASVSKIEEFGLNILGFDIVNVAQKMSLNLSGNELSVSAATDVFPSASLSVNGNQLFQYNQPSFRATHGRNTVSTFADNGRGGSMMMTTVPRRPAPQFYNRYNR